MIYISPSHFLCSQAVSDVSFKITPQLDRLQNRVSGKKKKGAQRIKKGEALCRVSYSDSTGEQKTYNLLSPVGGQLLEANDLLDTQPSLLTDKVCP